MFAPPVAKMSKVAGGPSGKPKLPRSVRSGRADGGIGNQATLRLLAAPTTHTRPAGAATRPGVLQTKLVVGDSHDPLEHEAERTADHVMRMPPPARTTAPLPAAASPIGPDQQRVSPARDPAPANAAIGEAPNSVHDALRAPGQPLDTATRGFFEPRFGADFSQVRVHADQQAAQSARAIGAKAYTAGHSIVFGAAAFAPSSQVGRRLLAHELTHVVQQSAGRAGGAAAPIQRYEAGEHAQFGETGKELKALINAPAYTYTVDPGDTPSVIATAFNVPLEELLRRNKDKVKQRPVKGHKGKTVPAFDPGTVIEIPRVPNQPMQDALKANELSYQAGQADPAGKRAQVTYGEGIAMGGDLFATPGQVDATPKDKVERLQGLIQGEKTSSKSGTFVDSGDWQTATDGRFTDLALQNQSHFSPSNPALAPAASPASAPNNRSEWQRYHTEALHLSQAGDQDKSLQVNAFGDHFLTDAFSAGHLINKLDVMEKFKGNIHIEGPGPMTKNSKLVPDSKKFFDQVAQLSFVGKVKTLYSNYETVEWKGGFFRPNIDSVDRFSALLQGIYMDQPDRVANAVGKTVHDDLDTKPGGVEVENLKGDKWQLSGDRTLNPKTLEVGRKAVAQSQFNVLSVFQQTSDKLDLPKLFKAVWDYVPHPTAVGAADVKTIVDRDTDPKQAALVAAVAKMITDNYDLILKELVRLNILKKA